MRLKQFKAGVLLNISIKQRLILYFLLLVFFPVSIICTIVYNKSQNIILNNIYSAISKNLDMIEVNLLQKFQAIDDISTLIYMNPELQNILSSKSGVHVHPADKIDIVNELSALDKILESYNGTKITKTKLIPILYIYNRPEYMEHAFSDKVNDLGSIMYMDWYKSISHKAKYTITGLNSSQGAVGKADSIRIAKMLFGLKNPEIPYAGLLTVDVGIEDFSDILKDFAPTPKSSVYILDRNAVVIASPDMSLIGKSLMHEGYARLIFDQTSWDTGSFDERINGRDALVSFKKISDLQWTIVTVSPLQEIYDELLSFNKIMALIIAVCAIFALIMSLLLAENVSSPIRKLVKSMARVQQGNFEIKLEYKRKDEFVYLIEAYKKMVKDIQDLINRLYISEVRKKEAELKSLQAQINPHFLYNTLDSVNWLAIEHNAPNISTMVTALSDFFRYSLSKGHNIIPLADEKKQIESYLAIQKVRFTDKLEYNIDFSLEVLKYLTVKLILQPIVENAIIHGIEKKRGKGTISITAAKEGTDIMIVISDDGVGADVESLNEMLVEKRNSPKAYGIRNVNQRIKQVFGEQYGVAFMKNSGRGITVRIKIPATTTLEVSDVENDTCR